MKNRIIVTGGAGFIGSHFVDRVLLNGNEVTVIDNLSSGRMEFLKPHLSNNDFTFKRLDLLDLEALKKTVRGADIIYHLAANPEVRIGAQDTRIHLEQNIIAT